MKLSTSNEYCQCRVASGNQASCGFGGMCGSQATNAVELAATDSRQLKAEIAALIPKVEACSGYARNGEAIRSIVAKMRQLSAVQ